MSDDTINQQLQSLVDDLRRYATRMLRRTDPALTIQATDLVNMAYLKLLKNGKHVELDLSDPSSIFGLYVTTMKNLLRDYLRTRKRQKRGGSEGCRVPVEMIDQLEQANVDPAEFIDQLDELEAMGEGRQASVVAARVFYKLSNAEIASQLQVSIKTIEDDLRKARAWLKERLPESPINTRDEHH